MVVTMNVIIGIRFLVISLSTISLVLVPRLLDYFGFKGEVLDAMMSPWFTFIVFLVVGSVLTYPLLKKIKLAVPIILFVVGAAIVLTFYFCDLPLP